MFVRTSFSAFLVAFGVAMPSLADPTECLAAPTQNCVFDLALEAADIQTNFHFWATGVLQVAFLQVSVADERSEATLEHFMINAHLRAPDVGTIVTTLYLRRAFYLASWLDEAPRSSRQTAEFLLELEPPSEGSTAVIAAASYLSSTGDRDRVFELIQFAGAAERPEIISYAVGGFLERGDMATVDDLTNMVPDGDARASVEQRIFRGLLSLGNYEQAEQMAATLADDESAEAFSQLALRLALSQQLSEARRVADYLISNDLVENHPDVAANLARVFAEAGSESLVEAMFQSIQDADERYIMIDAGRVSATAAMVSGDLAEALDYLGTRDTEASFSVALRELVTSHVRSGQTDLSPFFENLPEQYLSAGLTILGEFQATQGDLEGARTTFERLQSIGERHQQVFDEGRFALESLMVERGLVSEAVALAYQREDSVALSMLAVMIE